MKFNIILSRLRLLNNRYRFLSLISEPHRRIKIRVLVFVPQLTQCLEVQVDLLGSGLTVDVGTVGEGVVQRRGGVAVT